MSKLAHSHQPTMDEIEARSIADRHAFMDDEANTFAFELLMPEHLLRIDLAKGMAEDIADDVGITRLARKYKVPMSIMALRIGQLQERAANNRNNNSEKGQNLSASQEQSGHSAGTFVHDPGCAYHLDQYFWECTCAPALGGK